MCAELSHRVRDTSGRYQDRGANRARSRDTLRTKGILHVDDPERVGKRLARIGVDPSFATAVAGTPPGAVTGRGLPRLAPEQFGAPELALERLLGRNDLLDIGFLEAGYRAARSVGRVRVRGADGHVGTGFLVSPSVLLTNNHVLTTVEVARRGVLELNYQAGIDGSAQAPVLFELAPDTFFAADAGLDYAMVAVKNSGRLAEFGWLRLIAAEGKAILGELVNIVQHPNGEPKQLALRENRLVDLLPDFVHYETDTAPGSSGSPVFNDQWEVVALHHSGVPKKDEAGRWLSVDGRPWTEEMGEDRLAWQANEGVRVSRVLTHLRGLQLAGEPARLRDEVLAAPTPETRAVRPGITEITVPVRIVLDVGAPAEPVEDDTELQAALAAVEAARDRPYYDADADAGARQDYYAAVDRSGRADELRAALTDLVTRTHLRRPKYQPAQLLYPWVDLHPDRRLRSIYSGVAFTAEELVRADADTAAARRERWRELLRENTATFAERVALIEKELLFNCEHVVPQSWFAKAEPMRGDLHHLFACEPKCNSFRGNTPYVDFTDQNEATLAACGRSEAPGFEPAAGKGPVARATLYFLLRYPGEIDELTPDRLETLLNWHEHDPATHYERHRNVAIAEIQGNRNPFVDDPDLARLIDLGA